MTERNGKSSKKRTKSRPGSKSTSRNESLAKKESSTVIFNATTKPKGKKKSKKSAKKIHGSLRKRVTSSSSETTTTCESRNTFNQSSTEIDCSSLSSNHSIGSSAPAITHQQTRAASQQRAHSTRSRKTLTPNRQPTPKADTREKRETCKVNTRDKRATSMREIRAPNQEQARDMNSQETRTTCEGNTQDTRETSLRETRVEAHNITWQKKQTANTQKLPTTNTGRPKNEEYLSCINEETVRWKVCSNYQIKDSQSLEIYKANRRRRYYELAKTGSASSRYYVSVT